MADDQNPTPGDDMAKAGDSAAMQDIVAMQAELNRFKDIAARAQADLQNAKARMEKDSQDLRKFATEGLILRILPTLDNFQRAFLHIPKEIESNEWVKGVSAIEADLMRQMADAGLSRMQVMGEMANSDRHEILTIGPGEEGKVTEILEEGYELNGRVIRPAKVKVGDGSKT